MDLRTEAEGTDRFSFYLDQLTEVIGHADRERPLRDYCAGLLVSEGRKSVEPMAAVTAPERTAAQHQSLLHFVGEGRWSPHDRLDQKLSRGGLSETRNANQRE